MLIEKAETLCSDTALCTTKVKTGFKIVDVENDFILADGERIKVIEVGEQEPDFGSIVAYGSFGIASCAQVVS